MSQPDASRRLCFHGATLVLLGLLTGVLIPVVTNPRLGLSAHTGGVQNGILLLAIGLAWSHVRLAEGLRTLCAHVTVASLYLLWLANLLGAIFGTSRATPIAGAGFAGEPWQELLVGALLGVGALGILVGIGLAVWGLRAGVVVRD